MAGNSTTIIYDVASKAILIEYRDKVIALAGP